MKLDTQKKIAARVAGCSKNKISLDPERLDEVKEAITKTDIRSLIKDGAIKVKMPKGTSRARARKTKRQKSKGLKSHAGSRKGKSTARSPKKKSWINKIRVQRKFIKELKDKEIINKKQYRELRSKTKGGFFRSKRHIKIFLEKLRSKNE